MKTRKIGKREYVTLAQYDKAVDLVEELLDLVPAYIDGRNDAIDRRAERLINELWERRNPDSGHAALTNSQS